jgi:RecJ-like exonuclease
MPSVPVTITDDESEHHGEVVQLPARYEVCSRCDGEGKSSAHLGSFSREDFDEDPDFAEDYMNGAYDIPCEKCKGQRVVPVINREACTTDDQKRALEHLDDQARWRREAFNERKQESLMCGASTLRDWDGVYPD